jgi:hypothetical protein
LISEDEVLTNDHCVGMSLGAASHPDRFEGIPCEGDVFASFASYGESGAVRAQCRSIRFRSGERGIGSVDYAVIQLKEKISARPRIRVAKKGLADGTQVGIFRVQMDGDTGFGGTQSRLDCQASHRTFVYPQLDHAEAPLMTLGDCPIVLGNSGAPVFHSSGELAGIIQGYLAVRSNEELDRELREHLLDGTFGLTGVATQVHCLDRIGLESPVTCTALPELKSMGVTEFLAKHLPESPFVLPETQENWRWYPPSKEDGVYRTYRSGPVCASIEAFHSAEVTFQSGIDSRLQATWKRINEEAGTTFLRRTGVDAGRVLYGSGDVSLAIPACPGI